MSDLHTRLISARKTVELQRASAAEGESHLSKLSDSLIACSLREQEVGYISNALDLTYEAAGHLRSLTKRQPLRYQARLAKCLHLLSVRYAAVGSKDEALDAARDSITLWRQLVLSDARKYGADCLRTGLHLASCYTATRSPRQALAVRHEMLSMLEQLVEDDPSKYSIELARQLSQTARQCVLQLQQAKGIELYRRAITLWREHAVANVAEYGPPLAETLRSLAFELTIADSFAERAKLRREALLVEANAKLQQLLGWVSRLVGSVMHAGTRRSDK